MDKVKSKRKPLTNEQRAERNKKARARHWRKTNVSESTIRWMDKYNFL